MEQISAWRVNSLNFYLTPLGEIIKVMDCLLYTSRQWRSDFHLTKGNYLYPLVENYIAKYNAEYGEADRQDVYKRQKIHIMEQYP